jgi:glycine/D-amino acid oxidase-like deaminating enzyme
VPPTFPLEFDPTYTEVAVRGISRMIPAFARYFDRLPRTVVDGGYYTKTRENRFLAGPLAVAGAFVTGALSGYGLMSGNVAGELVATHITGGTLPAYAPAFAPSRYDDPAYAALVERWGDSGQL